MPDGVATGVTSNGVGEAPSGVAATVDVTVRLVVLLVEILGGNELLLLPLPLDDDIVGGTELLL